MKECLTTEKLGGECPPGNGKLACGLSDIGCDDRGRDCITGTVLRRVKGECCSGMGRC